jgi:small ligand-binding sensory domain FIST
MVITRSEGGTVYELDGKPAVQRLAELLELDPSIIRRQALSLGLTLGEKLGDPFAPFDEGNYVNRLVIGADPTSGSLDLLDTDMPSGLRVQLMLTDTDEMCASADACACALMRSADDGEQNLLALYIDCASRSSTAFGGEMEEAELVGRHIPEGIPFIGVYAGVEIAPMRGRSRPLDWSGVLTLWRLRGGTTNDTERIGVQ